MNLLRKVLVALTVLAIAGAGCARRIDMRPGRDAYYQVTSQFVPAQATGSHSQQATMITTGSTGDYIPSVDPSLLTTGR